MNGGYLEDSLGSLVLRKSNHSVLISNYCKLLNILRIIYLLFYFLIVLGARFEYVMS